MPFFKKTVKANIAFLIFSDFIHFLIFICVMVIGLIYFFHFTTRFKIYFSVSINSLLNAIVVHPVFSESTSASEINISS